MPTRPLLPHPLASAAAPRTRRALVLPALLAVLALVVAACTNSGASESASEAPHEGKVAAVGPPTSPAPPPEPDALADPGVGPGECRILTYTPPTATEPMPGELCRPAENQRDVAVMVVHGGSGISGSYEGMRRWANRYLAEGYVTFLPEYHLFDVGYESPVFPHPEQNIKAAVQYLRGVGNAIGIRKDRIVVQGQSAGARVGSVVYTTPDDPWFAGPELYPGISDAANGFIGYYHPYDGTMQYADQYFGGNDQSYDPKVHERLARADAISLAGQAVGPALFITGSRDWDVIITQQDAFVAKLQAKALHAEAHVIDGGYHGFDEGGSRLSKLGEQSAEISLRWLNDQFPQDPPREAQTAPIDLNVLPNATGSPPSTYVTRPKPSGGYGNRSGAASGSGTGSGGGSADGSTTTVANGSTTTSVGGPSTTSGASTTVAPSTTSTPTTQVTTPPPSTVPTTVVVTTAPPPPTTAAGGGGGGAGAG